MVKNLVNVTIEIVIIGLFLTLWNCNPLDIKSSKCIQIQVLCSYLIQVFCFVLFGHMMDNVGEQNAHFLWRKFWNFSYSHNNYCVPQFELADKQAALEKIHWEAMTSNKKVEKLQEELDSMQGDISSFTLLLNRLTISDTAEYTDDYDIKPYEFNHLRSIVSLLTFFLWARPAYFCTLQYMW